MAFRRVTPETAAQMATFAAQQAEIIRKRHVSRVADLLKAAETPNDANSRLAAVAKWRHDQAERQELWRNTALLQITSGDRPDEVCAGLGFGRTALQQAVRAEESELASFTQFLYRARPTKEAS